MFHKTLHEHEWCTNNIPETACVASPVRVSGFSAPPMPLNAYSTLKNRAIQLYTSTSTTSTRPRLAESSSYVLGVGRRGLRTPGYGTEPMRMCMYERDNLPGRAHS